VWSLRKVHENRDGFKMSRTYRHLVYADDVCLLDENVITVKRNTGIVLVAGKDTGTDVNVEKTQTVFMSRESNSGQNHNIKKDN